MSEMTQEEKREIAEIVADGIKTSGLLEPERKFTPGADPKEGSPIAIVESPEDRIAKDPKGGFNDMGEMVCAMAGKGSKWYGNSHFNKLKAYEGAMMKIAGTMNEGDMAQGGYLVPVEFRNQLLQNALENSIAKARSTIIPMQTNRITIPAVVDATHVGSFFGGIIPARTAEAATKTPTKPAFHTVNLTLHKLTGMIYVTDELLADSPMSLPPIITALFGGAIAFQEDADYLQGTGVNMPLGAFNAGNPSLIGQAIEPAQPINTILWQNIVNMWSRLWPQSQRNAVWVANNECFPQLASMAMAVGAGGVPVWMPGNGVSGSPFGSLMGRPLFLCEKMQPLSTAGDIGLADFSQYLIGQKAGGMQTATSMHYRFNYDEQAFRFVIRYDGRPWWLSDLTPYLGVNTLSPFVILNGRP